MNLLLVACPRLRHVRRLPIQEGLVFALLTAHLCLDATDLIPHPIKLVLLFAFQDFKKIAGTLQIDGTKRPFFDLTTV